MLSDALTGVFIEPPAPVVVMSPDTVQLSPRARLLVGVIVDVLAPNATVQAAVNAVGLLLHRNDSLLASQLSALVTESLNTKLMPLPSFDTMAVPVAGAIDDSDAVGAGGGGVVGAGALPSSPPPPPPPQPASAIATRMAAFDARVIFMTFPF
ncbi:MAG: hypothetical protein PHV99_03895 [Candidatus Pacebacteria bacterium]|nr:hypothetical protein [Candidatus Paceibacterota bacterium]